MAAWQRLSAGAACAGLAAPCPQFPAAPWVCTTCALVCAEAQGCFPARKAGCCRERGTAARAFRNNCAHRSIPRYPPLALLTGSGSLCREQATNRPHKNRTRSHGGGEKTKQTNNNKNTKRFLQCHAGVCSAAEPCSGDSEPGPPLGPARPWSQR